VKCKFVIVSMESSAIWQATGCEGAFEAKKKKAMAEK
jgi:hypothetical protein